MDHHPSIIPYFFFFLLLLLFRIGNSDINQDKAKCTDALVGISTCLPYVTINSKEKTPTIDCCSGLKQVLKTNLECLCILVKDRNDPSLNLNVNITLAVGLPDTCHLPSNISQCIDLLHLNPNSTDAKVFQGVTSSDEGSNSTTPAPPAPNGDKGKGSSENVKTNGGSRTLKWFKKELALGLFLIYVFLPIFPSISCLIN